MSYIILAPHADDEIIGCYELLLAHSKEIKTVCFATEEAIEEAVLSSQMFSFDRSHIDYLPTILYSGDTLVCPDPFGELHPMHKRFGFIGVNWAQDGHSTIFYSTNMNVPYIHEVKYSGRKQYALDHCYDSKRSLWEFDHKYFLFEGYSKWIRSWDV
jgi:hypothetical protein